VRRGGGELGLQRVCDLAELGGHLGGVGLVEDRPHQGGIRRGVDVVAGGLGELVVDGEGPHLGRAPLSFLPSRGALLPAERAAVGRLQVQGDIMFTSVLTSRWRRTGRAQPVDQRHGARGGVARAVCAVAAPGHVLTTASLVAAAAAAVLALAVPAGASTGAAQISPEHAGYTAAGAAMPAHWWQAEGNAKDSVGTDNGRLVGAGFGPGVLGPDQAFSFADGGQRVVFNKSGANPGRGDFTLAFDIKTTATHSQAVWEKRIACDSTGTPFWGFRMTGTIGFELFNGTAAVGPVSTTSINDGKWHQVVATRHLRTISLYIDGNLEATATSATTVNVTNDARMRAGVSSCDGIDGTHPFTGELDELMIFRTAFTQQQIQALGS
jgi:hypothetical protein